MDELIVHSFEAGRRGKPDEFESQLAMLIGAHFLEQDPEVRFDIRVCGGYDTQAGKPAVRVSGEVSEMLIVAGLEDTLSGMITRHYNTVHNAYLGKGGISVSYCLKQQSDVLSANGNAGDSGNPIAVAYRRTPNNLPWERFLAVGIRDTIDGIFRNNGDVPDGLARESGISRLPGLRPDGKVSVEAGYLGAVLQGITNITIAAEHEECLPIEQLRESLAAIARAYIISYGNKFGISFGAPAVIANGNGGWHAGGWKADEGSREAKPYRDGFATYGTQEDSFAGEDPSKPSGTGTFLARYIAVSIVDKGLAQFARVSLRYTIGREDVGLNVWTNGTGTMPQKDIEEWVRKNIPLRIKDSIEMFGLKSPVIYRKIADASDFFHDPLLPWNMPIKIYK